MFKKFAWIPLPIFAVAVAILNSRLPRVLPVEMIFEPDLLFPILSTIFTAGSLFTAAYIAAKAYSKSGMFSLLLLGASVFSYALGGTLSSWVVDILDGQNLLSTIGNTRSLLSSIFALLSVTIATVGIASERTVKRARLHVTVLYAAVSFFFVLLTIATIQGVTPPFFVQGVGQTSLRQTVVQTTILLFAVSSLQMIMFYFKSKANFMYWGSLGFMLIATGSFALFFQRIAGDPIAWTARISQYYGSVCLLIGLLPSRRAGSKEQ